jgi:hypothetical protein
MYLPQLLLLLNNTNLATNQYDNDVEIVPMEERNLICIISLFVADGICLHGGPSLKMSN